MKKNKLGTLADRLKFVRQQFELSLRGMGKCLNVSNVQLSRIETGKQPVTENMSNMLESVLQVNHEWMLGDSKSNSDIWVPWSVDQNLLLLDSKYDYFKKNGISTRGELVWIAEQIQIAWVSSKTATSTWVANLVQCIDELLRLEIVNCSIHENYLDSALPPGSSSKIKITDRPLHLLPELFSKKIVDGNYAGSIASCFITLIRDAVYKNNQFTPEFIARLSSLISPWYLYLIRASTSFKGYKPPIDFSSLTTAPQKSGTLNFKRGRITGILKLSPTFQAELTIGDRASINCDSLNIYALYDTLKTAKSNNGWTWRPIDNKNRLGRDDFNNSVSITLSETEIKDLEKLLLEIISNDDVRVATVHDIAKKYGAV